MITGVTRELHKKIEVLNTITINGNEYCVKKNMNTFILGNDPLFVVPNATYNELVDAVMSKMSGFMIENSSAKQQAEQLFAPTFSYEEDAAGGLSQQAVFKGILSESGFVVFISAFLGLALLLKTGSILYFKQIAESDDEQASYRTLRQLGFTTTDIMRGIYKKQLFNFGAPLLIGILHSYFAVKSGWFIFCTEMMTPFVITVCIYTVIYFSFALFTVYHYKKVVQQAL